jgi:hypothetical protein
MRRLWAWQQTLDEKRTMRTLPNTLLCAAAFLLLAACAGMKSTKAPGTDLTQLKTFYVQRLPADQRGIERLISERLNALGYQSTFGLDAKPPAAVDALVTYQDKWMWDITMYMLQLDVQIRDPNTSMVLASAQSYRPSLQRTTPAGMVEEVLNEIFKQ